MIDEIRWAVVHVLSSGARRRFLFADRGKTFAYLLHFLRRVVPKANAGLAQIRAAAEHMPDDELRAQALSSIEHKGYHVAGATIFATFLPPDAAEKYVAAVVPLESIYDYLDNVCDRHRERDSVFFRSLHRAIADALDPDAGVHDYYADGPAGDDGGYLQSLVQRSQTALRALHPSAATLESFRLAARLYADMQTFSHLDAGVRDDATVRWYEDNRHLTPALDWHEFTAACGSQFQIYGPLFEEAAGRSSDAAAAFRAHFPDVAALHVLLDSFIDRDEDALHGDLNLVRVYGSERAFRERATWLCAQANTAFDELSAPFPHRFVVRIMLLFYLTHPKVYRQGLNEQSVRLLTACERRIT